MNLFGIYCSSAPPGLFCLSARASLMIGRLRSLKICLGDAIRHLRIRFHLIWRRVRVFLLELAFDVSSKEVVENFGLKRVTILLLGLDLPRGCLGCRAGQFLNCIGQFGHQIFLNLISHFQYSLAKILPFFFPLSQGREGEVLGSFFRPCCWEYKGMIQC